MKQHIEKLERNLMRAGRWRYLRYLHFKHAVASVANEIESVCIVGGGLALSELAVAMQFPHIHFTVTDIVLKEFGFPCYHGAMEFGWRVGVDNISYSIWNVLEPTKRRFDLVASTEVVEHIAEDRRACANMTAAARKYVYCLVPFADAETNGDPARRARALAMDHKVCGYDEDGLKALFPEPQFVAGTYWTDAGCKLRQRLTSISLPEIDAAFPELAASAQLDLRHAVPKRTPEAQGIKILAPV